MLGWRAVVSVKLKGVNKVRKYLVFHDSMTFGLKGEDGSEPGLRAAIRWFQRNHAFPVWRLIEDRQFCNGLVVLGNVRAGL